MFFAKWYRTLTTTVFPYVKVLMFAWINNILQRYTCELINIVLFWRCFLMLLISPMTHTFGVASAPFSVICAVWAKKIEPLNRAAFGNALYGDRREGVVPLILPSTPSIHTTARKTECKSISHLLMEAKFNKDLEGLHNSRRPCESFVVMFIISFQSRMYNFI